MAFVLWGGCGLFGRAALLAAVAGWGGRGGRVGLWRQFLFAVVEELVVVGQHEGGERQGDDHAQHAEQTAPHGEGEQDDGGVEARNLAHHLGHDDAVLNDLHDAEDNHRQCQYEPEVLPRVGRLQQGEQHGGHQGYQLQVGDHVQQADEEAEADGHGEIDDEESDAEHHAHEEGHEGLAAEVAVHVHLHVGDDGLHKLAVLGGHELDPAVGDGLIVEQDEEDVEQDDERGEDAHHEADRVVDEAPNLGHEAAQGVAQVLFGEELLQVVGVDVLLDEVLHCAGDGGVAAALGEVLHEQVLQPHELLYDRGNKENPCRGEQQHDGEHGAQDGHHAVVHPQAVLVELHQRIEEVGHEPGDEEGEQHTAQVVDQVEESDEQGHCQQAADETVEGDFLFQHMIDDIWAEAKIVIFHRSSVVFTRKNNHFPLFSPFLCETTVKRCTLLSVSH